MSAGGSLAGCAGLLGMTRTAGTPGFTLGSSCRYVIAVNLAVSWISWLTTIGLTSWRFSIETMRSCSSSGIPLAHGSAELATGETI